MEQNISYCQTRTFDSCESFIMLQPLINEKGCQKWDVRSEMSGVRFQKLDDRSAMPSKAHNENHKQDRRRHSKTRQHASKIEIALPCLSCFAACPCFPCFVSLCLALPYLALPCRALPCLALRLYCLVLLALCSVYLSCLCVVLSHVDRLSRQDKTRQDKTRARRDKTHDQTRRDKTRQGRQGKAEQDKAAGVYDELEDRSFGVS